MQTASCCSRRPQNFQKDLSEKKVSNDREASLKVIWTATVILITLVLVPIPQYQKLKCPFRVGPRARIARTILCQQRE